MFRVRKSIKHFRDDPAWTYRKSGQECREYLATFEQDGYPFSLGPLGAIVRNLFQGTVQGRPAALFHLTVRMRGGASVGSNETWVDYSAAVVTLPRALPATAFTSGHFVRDTRKGELPAIPAAAGPVQDVPGGGPLDAVRRQSVDTRFAVLVDTPQVHRLTREAGIGWRIDGDRIIGWTRLHKPFDEIEALAGTLIAVTGAFPEEAWRWPAGTAGA
jgi:hypothetical protein